MNINRQALETENLSEQILNARQFKADLGSFRSFRLWAANSINSCLLTLTHKNLHEPEKYPTTFHG